MLFTGRDIQRRIRREKVTRLERHGDNLTGHDGEILDTGGVCEGEGVPDDNVLVPCVFVFSGFDKGFDASAADGLVGERAARIELAVFVFGKPDCVVCEFGTAGVV